MPFEVRTTDEFAAWFAALGDGPAEEVATALTMIEKLGPAKAAPGSSEWLLWYEHEGAPDFVVADDWTAFHDATKEVVAHLDAPGFAAKLRALPREDAARLLSAVDKLKTASAVGRRGLALLVAGAQASAGRSVDPYATLRNAYGTVAAAMGLAERGLPAHSEALRELTLYGPHRHRLLYGVDVRREVALIVLGEKLERSFYGDSVRRAERIWHQFLQGNVEARDPAPPR